MKKTYSLDKISKLFNIPKSTLRYWESENLIKSQRNKNNDYREYTHEDLITICDIMFYRSLNVPIKKLKSLYNTPLYENVKYLKSTYDTLQEEINKLEEIQIKLAERIHKFDTLMLALNGKYPFKEPFFNQIIHIDPGSGKNLDAYLINQNALALCVKPNENPLTIYGVIPSYKAKQDILWEKKDNYKYKPCLVEVNEEILNWELIQPHLKELKNKNYTIHSLVLSFLIPDKSSDYYLGWIEYN